MHWREQVRTDWVDYNGHLSEAYYVLVFGHATDAVMETVGMDATYRQRTGASLFTVEAHLRYLAQVRDGEVLEVRSSVVGARPRLLRLWHEMWSDGTVRATEEVLAVHVDTRTGSATPFPAQVAAAIEARRVPEPEGASGRIRLTP